MCGFDAEKSRTEQVIRVIGNRMLDNGTKPELECRDKTDVDMVMRLYEEGWLIDPLHFRFCPSSSKSNAKRRKELTLLKESIPSRATWSVSVAGENDIELISQAVSMCGNISVVDAADIKMVTKLIKSLGSRAATPAETRSMLELSQRYRLRAV